MELALALPAVVTLMLSGIVAVVAVTHKLGCVARARDTALAAARGAQTSPANGESVEFQGDGTVVVTVATPYTSCTSTAAVEP